MGGNRAEIGGCRGVFRGGNHFESGELLRKEDNSQLKLFIFNFLVFVIK